MSVHMVSTVRPAYTAQRMPSFLAPAPQPAPVYASVYTPAPAAPVPAPGATAQPWVGGPQAAPTSPGSFYAINGLFGDLPFIGFGMNNLQSAMTGDSRGYSRHSEGRVLAEIVQKHQAGTLARPLVLVGHSLGGNAVTRIATALHDRGIPVDYMAVVDAPAPLPIPPNVAQVDNFLSTASFVGRRLSRGETIVLQGVGHVALGNHPAVQRRIMAQAGRPVP